jgi:hypothetical protein
MTESVYAPTGLWPVRWSCDVSTQSPTVTGLAVQFASTTLWALTGRQFGLTSVTLRPCLNWPRQTPYPDGWLSWPGTQPPPLGASFSSGGGYWFGGGCGTCNDGCSCTYGSEVKLPATVNSITQVKIDGAVLANTAYRVDDNRLLVRIDGFSWPHTNNLLANDTSIGTWSVTAQYGQVVPSSAALAVGELACEFIRGLNGEDCRLPRTITTLARQGVTITLPDLGDSFKKGHTGLYLVDLFITTWNPKRLRERARTYSVDIPVARRAGT